MRSCDKFLSKLIKMEQSDKPFACSTKGCEMSFTNEDHLNWHQKKHDMMLNLGLTCTKGSEIADQTPTPTRFIRNCEEVGLFQDLQNVNPFDEIFKKAVESSKSGSTLEIPQNSSDDTLHTPQIYPHIEENQTNNEANESPKALTASDFAPLNNALQSPTVKNDSNVPMIIIDSEDEADARYKEKLIESPNEQLKKRIKEAIKLKSSVSVTENSRTTPIVKPQSSYLTPVLSSKLKITKNKSKSLISTGVETSSDQVARLREMNRAAQFRCRARKQVQWKKMEAELTNLKVENKKLRSLNLFLDSKVRELEAELVKQAKEHEGFVKKNMVTSLKKSSSDGIKNSSTSPTLSVLPTSPRIITRVTNKIKSQNTKIVKSTSGSTNTIVNTHSNVITSIDKNDIIITIPPSGTYQSSANNSTTSANTNFISSSNNSSIVQNSVSTAQQVIYIVSPPQTIINPSSNMPMVVLNDKNFINTNVSESGQSGFRKIVPKLQLRTKR